MERAFVFPIPQTARTAPAAAGFPEAEQHILDTSDGEKIVVWHVPAKPDRPVVGERLFALAHEPKQFVRFPEGGHDNLHDHGAIETARRFINAPEAEKRM